VRELAKRGGVSGTIRVHAQLARGTAHNLWAKLPGRTDEYYVVMGHYDSHFAQAVQDASGISIVLALAAHFAGVRDRLPLERGIVFLAVDAHTIGRVGERHFVDRHLDGILQKTALVISAEHIGRRLQPQEDLSFAVSEVPSMRMLLTSWRGPIPEIAKAAVLHTDYRRSMVIPQRLVQWTTGKARGISGEPFEAGLPTVGLLPAPPYLQFPEDTTEAVAEEELVPSINLLIALIRAAEGYPLNAFR
jgi:Zn-dependent M28 family amino/carboxypeptidase